MISNHIINVLRELVDTTRAYIVCINGVLYPDVKFKHTKLEIKLTFNYTTIETFDIVLYHLYNDELYTTTYLNCKKDQTYYLDKEFTYHLYDDMQLSKISDNVRKILNRYNNAGEILC